MKLVASLIVKDELSRLLELCIASLQEFCDEIRVLDDGSTDGSYEWLVEQGCSVLRNDGPAWAEHEGRARQRLLEWTLASEPTHVLAIDADELVDDGLALRRTISDAPELAVWTLIVEEVWKADQAGLWLREDGGWRRRPAPLLWRVPAALTKEWRISERALACGREPLAVRRARRDWCPSGAQLLHFGWTREAERASRYERYVALDGGRFHSASHLRSIMWPERKMTLTPCSWPDGLVFYRDKILQALNGERQ
jgi:glycosyltransferase involved in cell wall biosynthesis